MVNNHYRWDFIGLSTDTKPTPETSEKVVNGSTFYCSDTSKLYVFYKDTWYERQPLGGGGGGGTTYTAGDGIDITNDIISVDTDTIQEKLTAGTGIDITDNTISATGGGGGGLTELTSSDYNYPTDSPDGVALWTLENGEYHAEANVLVYMGQGYNDASGSYITVKDGIDSSHKSIFFYSTATGVQEVFQVATSNGSVSTGYPKVTNTALVRNVTGTSTTDVMSQNATTGMVFADPTTKHRVQIGNQSFAYTEGVAIGFQAYANATNAVGIGNAAKGWSERSVAIGSNAYAGNNNSVALGTDAKTSRVGEVFVGCENNNYGYNNTKLRVIGGVHDGQSANDAVTVAQVNATIDAINTALSTSIPHIGATS